MECELVHIGMSTVIGTPGTMSKLNGRVKVGAQPKHNQLIQAIANLRLIGKRGYYEEYRSRLEATYKMKPKSCSRMLKRLHSRLNHAIERAVSRIQAAGMTVIHARNRVKVNLCECTCMHKFENSYTYTCTCALFRVRL